MASRQVVAVLTSDIQSEFLNKNCNESSNDKKQIDMKKTSIQLAFMF